MPLLSEVYRMNCVGILDGILDFFNFNFIFVACVLTFYCNWCGNAGLTLLSFQKNIKFDPFGTLENWSPNDSDPCLWKGVHCVDSKVQIL